MGGMGRAEMGGIIGISDIIMMPSQGSIVRLVSTTE
jgi:hypothetical protein